MRPPGRPQDDRAAAPTGAPDPSSGIDWVAARQFLRARLATTLAPVADADLDDLAQEALIRLLRACRIEEPRDVQALMTRIAHRTGVDYVRRRVRWRLLLDPGAQADDVVDQARTPDELGDPVERLEFVTLEFFESTASPCRELAVDFFAQRAWEDVAKRLGETPAAIRKRWSRCVAMLREFAARNPDRLTGWADGR